MKPFRYLIFLLCIISICIFALFLFPKSGIKINDNLQLNFLWNFIQKADSTPEYADISNIIEKYESEINIENDSVLSFKDTVIEIQEDTLIEQKTVKKIKIDKNKIQFIEYPSGDSSVLKYFFASLNISNKKRVRILHYGDSQIEGDRITGYLRHKFQKEFGGSGPGLLTAKPRYAPSSSITHRASANWRKKAVYKNKSNNDNKYGLLGSFSVFTNSFTDTTKHLAWIELNRSGMAYRSVQDFTQCKVIFSNPDTSFSVKGFVNKELKWFELIPKSSGVNSFDWLFEEAPKKMRIEFESTKSPNIYTVALDKKEGVAVDNLPFRGSSGKEFSKLDYNHAKQMSDKLNIGLVILQFGVNVVPNVRSNYSFYEKMLNREIRHLKKIFNNMPILIVSLSDMARKQGNMYVSYPNIVKIKQAQKNVAKENNCAFWDLHSAMGGENSMYQWVNSSPRLATKDYVHFNRRGGNLVAKMLFDALMYEYNNYNGMNKGERSGQK